MRRIRVSIDGEVEQKFAEIKAFYGLENDTDVIRLAISTTHRIIKTGEYSGKEEN